MTDELNRPLPACGSVDFGNVAEVADCGHLLLARLQLGDDAAAADALLWVGKVEAAMPCYAAGDALHLLELYDLLHRFACGSAPDRRLLDACCLRAFEALTGGDSGVDECELFSAVSQGVNVRHDAACLGRPMMWYLATRERWVAEVDAKLPPAEAVTRARLLMGEDLTSLLPAQEEFKRHLASRYIPWLDAPERLDADVLQALLPFVRSIKYKYIPVEKGEACEQCLHACLAGHRSLTLVARRSYHLNLLLLEQLG